MDQAERKRILILDDEVPLCEVLKARLQTYHYTVEMAHDGKQGWDKLLNFSPDLLLLDIRMPDEDGYTLLRKIRSFRDPENPERELKLRQLPVIVITGTGEGMKPLFEQERIFAYLTKPIDSAMMKQLVEEGLKH